jgi:uroporphyrin-III C-methyltransferase
MAGIVVGLSPRRPRGAVARGDAASGRAPRGERDFPAGSVCLVGAGPGDPGLLTLRAAARLNAADVVYHDALVGEGVLALCRPGARLVPVGKRRGAPSWSQEAIEAALVCEARAGWRVVRLKGGDPLVFGRGGEEALTLMRAGVTCEIVPGLTSGTAVPAAAGIPLTHRGLSSSAAFVTAHDLESGRSGAAARRRIGALARAADTLVLFMGGAHLDRLRQVLLAAGLAPSTPAAIIENGTRPEQRVRRGALSHLAALGKGHGAGPLLVVVGRTVALAAALERLTSASDATPVTADAPGADAADATPDAAETEVGR